MPANLPCVVSLRSIAACGVAVEYRDITDAPDEPDPLPPEAGVIVVFADRTWQHWPLRRLHFFPNETSRAVLDIAEDYAAGRCTEASGPLFTR